ncbi:hypothetical protein PMZ80_007259 [Knufia obscura]|uniref:Protein-tyrosine-phosphatase n=2 Tax=Knufia TaxID=430999 RepID=A0AAN8I5N7_9EURO|nr:hypothetical protein PMZ80_007259 [Knufia obscura]KAK5953269.1 hypothetical protein OHC33_005837 [Knufia fluminis]
MAQLTRIDPTLPQYKPNTWDVCKLCHKTHIKGLLSLRNPSRCARPPLPHQVIDGLYISDMYTAAKHISGSFYHLEAPRITHVLSIYDGRCCERELMQQENSEQTKTYVHRKEILLPDLPQINLLDHFPEICRYIHRALNKPATAEGQKNKVLIHCYAGASRSATAVVAYLMWARHMSWLPAITLLRGIRPIVCPNSGFVAQLQLWEGLDCDLLKPIMPRRQAMPTLDHHLEAMNELYRVAGVPEQERPKGAGDWHSDGFWTGINNADVFIPKLDHRIMIFQLGLSYDSKTRHPCLAALRKIERPQKLESSGA